MDERQMVGEALVGILPADTEFMFAYRKPGEQQITVVSTMKPNDLRDFLIEEIAALSSDRIQQMRQHETRDPS